MEHVIGLALAYSHRAARDTSEQIKALHKAYVENLRKQPLAPNNEPAMSDHLSDLVAENVERLLAGVRKTLAV
jgi:hypothetical protein